MAVDYSMSEIREDIKWDNPTHTRIASIKMSFQVAGQEVTQDAIYGLYPELLEKLKASKSFRQLHNSDNLEISVHSADKAGSFDIVLNVKNTPYSYNHVGNPKQVAHDAVRSVFDARFKPRTNSL